MFRIWEIFASNGNFPWTAVQSTWKPNMEASSENYPWIYANKSGWMDSQTFFKWFEQFEEKTRYFEQVGIDFFSY